jgi:hypothetical protein
VEPGEDSDVDFEPVIASASVSEEDDKITEGDAGIKKSGKATEKGTKRKSDVRAA